MLKLERKTALKFSILVSILSTTLLSCMFIEGTSRFTAARWLNHRVHVGKWVLEKETLYRSRDIHETWQLFYGDLAPEPGLELAAVSAYGVWVLDEKMALLHELHDFSLPGFADRITEQNFKAFVKTFSKGPFTWEHVAKRTGVSILSRDQVGPGKESSANRFNSRVQGVAFGDFIGDGAMELVVAVRVGENDYRSKFLVLDDRGQIVSEKDSPLPEGGWRLAIIDTDLDGRRELIATSISHSYIFDDNLELEREFSTQKVGWTTGSLTFPYPDADDPPHFLASSISAIYSIHVTSFEGKRVNTYSAPYFFAYARATPVRLRADQPSYFAILGVWEDDDSFAFPPPKISRLRVFASDGTLVYDETLDAGIGITTMPSDRPGEEVLLIGGTGNVYGYKWNHDRSEK